jgi:hypothetical protein
MKKIVLTLLLLTGYAVSYVQARECEDDHFFIGVDHYYVRPSYALDSYWDWGYGPYSNFGEHYGMSYFNRDPYCYEPYYRRKKSEAALNEIQLLEKKKSETENAKQQISRVKVVEAKFYRQFTPDTVPISIAEITVQNKSDYPIITVFCRGKLVTHQTDKVIIDDTFKYDFPEELPPGETKTYDVPLNDFGKWSKAQPPDLVKFEIIVMGIETNKGAVLVTDFTDEDKQTLNKLKKRYLD